MNKNCLWIIYLKISIYFWRMYVKSNKEKGRIKSDLILSNQFYSLERKTLNLTINHQILQLYS